MILEENPLSETLDFLVERVLSVRPADAPDVDRHPKTFAIVERNEAGVVEAGVYVYVHTGWAYVDLIWVDEKRRGQGLGVKLMQDAEAEARRRGCHSVYVWTVDFEAPLFYEKLGYAKFVTFENFIPSHQRFGYRKRIAS
jgi:GNAT superfamily N-acetyltransferase